MGEQTVGEPLAVIRNDCDDAPEKVGDAATGVEEQRFAAAGRGLRVH